MIPNGNQGKTGPAFFCSSPSWGGLEINILRLARWLSDRGRPVTILSPPDTPLHREASAHRIATVILPRHRKYFDFRAARVTVHTLRRLGLSTMFVFHRNDTDVAAWTRFLGGRRIRVVYQQQMRLGVSRKDPVHALRYHAYAAWIAPLVYLRQEVLALTTVPEEKIHVIPLGIEFDSFQEPGPTRAEARKFFGIDDEALLFGIIGRIEPGKGQAFLVRALKSLREKSIQGRGAELLIVGDVTIESGSPQSGRSHVDELRALATSLGLREAIHFHPFIADNRMFYRAVDACVMATTHETYGMVTLEAMASGVPVIGTDSTGTREILEGGKLGLLYSPGDEESFLRQAGVIIAGKYGDEMIRDARETVRERYSHTRECDMMIELLDRLDRLSPGSDTPG